MAEYSLITPSGSGNTKAKSEVDATSLCSAYEIMTDFWPRQKRQIQALNIIELRDANRHQELPLARIKKIMKLDDDVRNQMISSEAPILFARAAEMFIEELTLRAWIHTDENKRRTLQKSDISMAISRCEQFDFLIDIVPRDESYCKQHSKTHSQRLEESEQESPSLVLGSNTPIPVRFENVSDTPLHYFVQMPVDSTLYQQPQQTTAKVDVENHQSAGPLIQLQNGQMVQATQIGQPIPFQTTPGQPVQLITMGGDGQAYQLQVQLPSETEIITHNNDY